MLQKQTVLLFTGKMACIMQLWAVSGQILDEYCINFKTAIGGRSKHQFKPITNLSSCLDALFVVLFHLALPTYNGGIYTRSHNVSVPLWVGIARWLNFMKIAGIADLGLGVFGEGYSPSKSRFSKFEIMSIEFRPLTSAQKYLSIFYKKKR